MLTTTDTTARKQDLLDLVNAKTTTPITMDIATMGVPLPSTANDRNTKLSIDLNAGSYSQSNIVVYYNRLPINGIGSTIQAPATLTDILSAINAAEKFDLVETDLVPVTVEQPVNGLVTVPLQAKPDAIKWTGSASVDVLTLTQQNLDDLSIFINITLPSMANF